MSGTKQYPPSDTKLEKLRRSGVIPQSRFVDMAGILSGLLIGVVAFRSVGLVEVRGFARESWSQSGLSAELAQNFFSVLGKSAGVFLFVYVAIRIVGGIISTRGLFTFGAVGFNPGRMFAWRQNIVSQKFSFFSILLYIAVLTAWGVLSWLLGFYFFREFSDSGNLNLPGVGSATEAGGMLTFVLENIIGWVLGAAVILGLAAAAIGYFVASLEFRKSHAMTRSELEAEYRETEVSPQMRQARRAVLEE